MAYTTVRTQKLTVANAAAAQRGFLATLVAYAAKRPSFTGNDLVKRFAGKEIHGEVISTERVVRYAYYCTRRGIFTAA